MQVQIQVSDEVWNFLRLKKCRPSQTFDDIIRDLFQDNKVCSDELAKASSDHEARKMTSKIAKEMTK